MEFFAIENAFTFVSMAPRFQNSAILAKETGDIYYISGLGDADELPEDVYDADKYIEIPHKNELSLGKDLVMDFVQEHLTEAISTIEEMFDSKGAYSKYKEFLENKGLLDKWHRFQDEKQADALLGWCRENGINIT